MDVENDPRDLARRQAPVPVKASRRVPVNRSGANSGADRAAPVIYVNVPAGAAAHAPVPAAPAPAPPAGPSHTVIYVQAPPPPNYLPPPAPPGPPESRTVVVSPNIHHHSYAPRAVGTSGLGVVATILGLIAILLSLAAPTRPLALYAGLSGAALGLLGLLGGWLSGRSSLSFAWAGLITCALAVWLASNPRQAEQIGQTVRSAIGDEGNPGKPAENSPNPATGRPGTAVPAPSPAPGPMPAPGPGMVVPGPGSADSAKTAMSAKGNSPGTAAPAPAAPASPASADGDPEIAKALQRVTDLQARHEQLRATRPPGSRELTESALELLQARSALESARRRAAPARK